MSRTRVDPGHGPRGRSKVSGSSVPALDPRGANAATRPLLAYRRGALLGMWTICWSLKSQWNVAWAMNLSSRAATIRLSQQGNDCIMFSISQKFIIYFAAYLTDITHSTLRIRLKADLARRWVWRPASKRLMLVWSTTMMAMPYPQRVSLPLIPYYPGLNILIIFSWSLLRVGTPDYW